MNGGDTEYDYAVVPVFHGIEGAYSITSVHSILAGVFLVEKDRIWGTDITDGYCDTTRNIPGSFVETIHNKYPTAVFTTIANYDTGKFNGTFVQFIEDECQYDFENDYSRTRYQKEVMDFLADRNPKILKHFDGRMWLIQVNPNPSDNAEDIYNDRQISFDWTEIGDYDNEEDLYNMNLIDITEEWWNQ